MRATAEQLLREARGLMASMGWCQGVYARDAYGKPCSVLRDACSICMEGAMILAWRSFPAGGPDPVRVDQSFPDALRCSGDRSRWNDEPGRTKEEVLAAFDRAIEEASR